MVIDILGDNIDFSYQLHITNHFIGIFFYVIEEKVRLIIGIHSLNG